MSATRQLEITATAEAVKTKLQLVNLEIIIQAHYKKDIVLNPETEYEEVISSSHISETERIPVDALSDEQWADFLNREFTAGELVNMVTTKVVTKAPKGIVSQIENDVEE